MLLPSAFTDEETEAEGAITFPRSFEPWALSEVKTVCQVLHSPARRCKLWREQWSQVKQTLKCKRCQEATCLFQGGSKLMTAPPAPLAAERPRSPAQGTAVFT